MIHLLSAAAILIYPMTSFLFTIVHISIQFIILKVIACTQTYDEDMGT